MMEDSLIVRKREQRRALLRALYGLVDGREGLSIAPMKYLAFGTQIGIQPDVAAQIVASLASEGFLEYKPASEAIALTHKGAAEVERQPDEAASNQMDEHFARMAIDEARLSVPEQDGRAHPKVGVVIVKDGRVLAKAHRGEFSKEHAEFIALERKLADISIAGATVYATLEPCTTRTHPKIPCAERLVERKVARVFIGMLDPNPDIRGRGQMILSDANIETQLFRQELMSQIIELNRDFIREQKQKSTPGVSIAGRRETEAILPSKGQEFIPIERFESRMDEYLDITLKAVSEMLGIEDAKRDKAKRIAKSLPSLEEESSAPMAGSRRPDSDPFAATISSAKSSGTSVLGHKLADFDLVRKYEAALVELERSHDITLEVLADVLDLKLTESKGHSKRVTAYAIAIARAMHLPDKEIRIIARGIFLHDIGKISVPDQILRKSGELTPDEVSIMKDHCHQGYRILFRIPFLKKPAHIVYAQQERYDGLGYPRGLKGDQIPLGARIFAIADTLDTMTSDQLDTSSFSIVRKHVQEQSGKQFDPKLVEIFLSLPDRIWQDLAEGATRF